MNDRTESLIAMELNLIRQALTVLVVNEGTAQGQITKRSKVTSAVTDRLIAQAEKDIGPH